jgi:hypothetical protein
MNFRNYCIAVVDNVNGIKEEISRISESVVKYVDGKGLIIATFSSAALVTELKEYFRENNRSFLLFELGEDNYGVNFTKRNIHDHLFSGLDNSAISHSFTMDKWEDKSTTATTTTSTVTTKSKPAGLKISDDEIKLAIDSLLDKGLSNLSSIEKKKLASLSKKIKK